MAARPAVTKVEIVSKKVGASSTRTHRIGSKCTTERNGGNLGEFLIWFQGHYYFRVDASKLLDYVQHTDNKPVR